MSALALLSIWTFDGTVQIDTATAEDGRGRELVATRSRSDAPSGAMARIIENDGEWYSLLRDGDLWSPPVNFADEIVIAVWYESATCGVEVDGWEVWDLGDSWHVDVRFHDAGVSCTDPERSLVAIALERRNVDPTWTRAVETECR